MKENVSLILEECRHAMNEKQKMASAEFLNSPRGTVTLVVTCTLF